MRGLQKFSQVFGKLSQLTKLNLNNNKLCTEENHDTSIFRDALMQCANLQELCICENSIYDTDLTCLIDAIKSMKHLKKLEISRNPCSGPAIASLYSAAP